MWKVEVGGCGRTAAEEGTDGRGAGRGARHHVRWEGRCSQSNVKHGVSNSWGGSGGEGRGD